MFGLGEFRRFINRITESGLRTAVSRASLYARIGLLHSYIEKKQTVLGRQAADFVAEDWDTLVLLDACRYDYFERENSLDGRLESRTSPGRTSMEFMLETFAGRKLHDTVYVTSNPHIERLDDDIFHAVLKEPLLDGWDDERGTVPPEAVTDAAIAAAETYPNKRLIVHYMQPHVPYLGSTAKQVYPTDNRTGWEPISDTPNDRWRVSTEFKNGNISAETVREMYRETLRIVLKDVERLLSTIDGKSVISADHGEFLGDRPHLLWPKAMFGHGNGRQYPRCATLCQVPWFVVEGETRRQIRSEQPHSQSASLDGDTVTDRLRDLGYV